MRRFYRKYLLHKYSDQLSAYAKRPIFILTEAMGDANKSIARLNAKVEYHIVPYEVPFLKHIGRVAYEQFLGEHSVVYKNTSQLGGERLAEHLRKLSIKNTLGNNYGFELRCQRKYQGKRLRKAMSHYRWGAMVNVNEVELKGLIYLFPEAIIIRQDLDFNRL